ncbi:APC family permease [Scytonema sp. NUACC26]|uniref:APC family permease n=1 Tax=Scytonema sp. NUACC26 TaxID=3140176 RepID=UPI0034DB8962
MSHRTVTPQLRRELGVLGATMMGLGSIIGTGVFVSIGIAAGIAGPGVIVALALAAFVATCNGLNSAQLAANHAVSGGTYEYGYKYLNPWLGFTAGWMFLLAKTASAATAALGFASYLLSTTNFIGSGFFVPTALIAVAILTGIVLSGLRRSNLINIIIVSVTLLSLCFFVVVCLPSAIANSAENLTPFFTGNTASVLQATALMFVAYTGYGRIATMGEEAKEPRKTIPRAMVVTLLLTMLLYMAVGVVGIGAVGTDVLGKVTQQTQAAPLEVAVRNVIGSSAGVVLAIGAMTAMLGVLLNLILGLSRMVLAMARRRDLPGFLARLKNSTTPVLAVLVVGIAIALLVLIGNVKTTWSFSAFNVLIYYSITNLAALQLPNHERLYPKWLAWAGLASCAFLAFWVEQQIWLVGLALIVVGLIWRTLVQLLTKN